MKGRWAPRLRSFGVWPSFTFIFNRRNTGQRIDRFESSLPVL